MTIEELQQAKQKLTEATEIFFIKLKEMMEAQENFEKAWNAFNKLVDIQK